jgi:hypothetical protein
MKKCLLFLILIFFCQGVISYYDNSGSLICPDKIQTCNEYLDNAIYNLTFFDLRYNNSLNLTMLDLRYNLSFLFYNGYLNNSLYNLTFFDIRYNISTIPYWYNDTKGVKSNNSIFNGTINVTGNLIANLNIIQSNNSASGNRSVVLGAGEVSSGNFNSILGGLNNRLTSTYGVISGGAYNSVGGNYGDIGGGFTNSVTATYGVIGGGRQNTVSFSYGNIGGGYLNKVSTGSYNSISGGYKNSVNALAGFIGGGYSNIASGYYSIVGGGSLNTGTGMNSFIGGGSTNLAVGDNSVIGGGINNNAGYYSSIVGGSYNTVSSIGGFVGGGAGNSISADYSGIGSGYFNTVLGYGSTISGGYANMAGSLYYVGQCDTNTNNWNCHNWDNSSYLCELDSFHCNSCYNTSICSGGFLDCGIWNWSREYCGNQSGYCTWVNTTNSTGTYYTFCASSYYCNFIQPNNCTDWGRYGHCWLNYSCNNAGFFPDNQSCSQCGDISSCESELGDEGNCYWIDYASKNYAAVCGGINNNAAGDYSAILGGNGNTAEGDNSIAIGSGIDVVQDDTIVLGIGSTKLIINLSGIFNSSGNKLSG